MKTKILFSILLLGIMISVFGQRPTLELTFTAENSGQYIPMDSILIENLTQGGDTTLFTPDTVLVLDYISSIGNNETIEENTFELSQNYPNPFTGKTEFNLNLQQKGEIKITIWDILGRELAHYEKTMERGKHSFTFYSGNEKYYLLTVTGKQTSKTIKMLNANCNITYQEKYKIVYNGARENENNFKSQRIINNFGFNLGDELKYTAYTHVEETEIINAPMGSQTYTFQFDGWTPCPGISVLTDPDGNTYNTVQIGTQCWMKENLNYETPTNSYLYDNDSANGDIYGRLYTWRAALSACPVGWHLPSDDEWKIMEMALGMSQSEADDTGFRGTDEGEKMKSISGWGGNGNGTNSSGFSALGGGLRMDWDYFSSLRQTGIFWSSTMTGYEAWIRVLSFYEDKVARSTSTREDCFSVRCIKD